MSRSATGAAQSPHLAMTDPFGVDVIDRGEAGKPMTRTVEVTGSGTTATGRTIVYPVVLPHSLDDGLTFAALSVSGGTLPDSAVEAIRPRENMTIVRRAGSGEMTLPVSAADLTARVQSVLEEAGGDTPALDVDSCDGPLEAYTGGEFHATTCTTSWEGPSVTLTVVAAPQAADGDDGLLVAFPLRAPDDDG